MCGTSRILPKSGQLCSRLCVLHLEAQTTSRLQDRPHCHPQLFHRSILSLPCRQRIQIDLKAWLMDAELRVRAGHPSSDANQTIGRCHHSNDFQPSQCQRRLLIRPMARGDCLPVYAGKPDIMICPHARTPVDVRKQCIFLQMTVPDNRPHLRGVVYENSNCETGRNALTDQSDTHRHV